MRKNLEDLKPLSIETYDHTKGGRPSICDVDNKQVM